MLRENGVHFSQDFLNQLLRAGFYELRHDLGPLLSQNSKQNIFDSDRHEQLLYLSLQKKKQTQ